MDVQSLKRMYPFGTKIYLIHMEGESHMPRGLRGVVRHVDDIGQIHVTWENGSSLALNYKFDDFEKVD